eukprot:334449-Chlamydomonas_euryale.AAC.2
MLNALMHIADTPHAFFIAGMHRAGSTVRLNDTLWAGPKGLAGGCSGMPRFGPDPKAWQVGALGACFEAGPSGLVDRCGQMRTGGLVKQCQPKAYLAGAWGQGIVSGKGPTAWK